MIVPGAASPGLAVPGTAAPGLPCTVLPAPTYFGRTDLVYSAQVWNSHLPTGGSPALGTNATAQSNTRTLGIRGVRFQGQDIPNTLGGTGTNGGASYTLANWTSALNILVNTLGTVPAPLGLPPTGAPNWPGGTDVVMDASGLTSLGYQFWQWLVTNSIAWTRLFEVANEPTNYGSAHGCTTMQNYFDMLWVNVPALKAWARSQGYPEIYAGGPALSGGEAFKLSSMESFLSLCLANYNSPPAGTLAADWIPDFVSAHYYEGGGTNSSPADLTTTGTDLDSLRSWITANMPAGIPIKIVISEYNYNIQANCGTDYTNQSVMNTYYADFFAMCTATSTDGRQRVWLANEFTIENSGTNLFLLNSDASVGIPGTAFAARAAAAPVQAGTVWSAAPGSTFTPLTVSSADTGHATEAGSVHAMFSSADSGHGADAGGLTGGQVRVSSADAGHGTGSGSVHATLGTGDAGHAVEAGSANSGTAPHSADTARAVESAFSYEASADTGRGTETFRVCVSSADSGRGPEQPLRSWPSSRDTSGAAEQPLRSWPVSADAGHGTASVRPVLFLGADTGHGTEAVHEIGIWTYVATGVRLLLPEPYRHDPEQAARVRAAAARLAGGMEWFRLEMRASAADRASAAERFIVRD